MRRNRGCRVRPVLDVLHQSSDPRGGGYNVVLRPHLSSVQICLHGSLWSSG